MNNWSHSFNCCRIYMDSWYWSKSSK